MQYFIQKSEEKNMLWEFDELFSDLGTSSARDAFHCVLAVGG